MPATDSYTLGPYSVDLAGRRVTRDGVPLKLAWRHFEALKLLVEANQEIVPKERFFQTLWPDTPIVDESNLTQCISQLRKALGNGDRTPFVENVPRIGYRLLVPAKRNDVELDHVATPASPTVAPPAIDLREPARSRPRLGIAAAVVVLVALAAGGGSWWWWTSRPAYLSRAAQDRGNEFTRRGDVKAAAQEFQLAVQLDPQNAVAYSELAHALQRLSFRDSFATPIGESPSVKAAARAVEIDPDCAGCHGTLGFFLFYHDWKWAAAEGHLARGLQLGPERHAIRPPYAMLLAATGRHREALEQIDLALKSQPYEVGWHVIRATILYLDRRHEESIAAADKALAINENERGPWEWRSKALFQIGRGEDAIKALAEVAFAEHSLKLDAAVREGGKDAGLRTLLEITGDWRSHKEQAWRRAPWRALLRDTDGALSELETAYKLRNVNLIYIGTDPVYDAIRSHPRFQRVLSGMGLHSSFGF